MSETKYKSLCILGRQPDLGLAELESLYGDEHVKPLNGGALLDIPAEEINFRQLGGTIKVARLLSVLPNDSWSFALEHLNENVPKHLQYVPDGKFTIGVSVYGPTFDIRKLNADLLYLKKSVKKSTGRSIRIVPNKSLALSSAQVLHNKLIHKGAWELILVRHDGKFYLAQTLFVQDIESYAARDQARPARDARVGMLPPKLAQIIINLAAGRPETRIDDKHWDSGDGLRRFMVLDPFCGTGVVLQEALLMGYSVYGTDIQPRLVDYSKKNLQWLIQQNPKIEGKVTVEPADATTYHWPGFSAVASELYLGRPLAKLPDEASLKRIILDVNTITKKFLKNLVPQLKVNQTICLAVPAWRKPTGELIRLPLLDKLTDMGYNYSDFKHVPREKLVYFRENQVVARQLLRLSKG